LKNGVCGLTATPVGRLVEQFLTAAYQATPITKVGSDIDLNTFSAAYARNFLDDIIHPFEHGG